MTEYAAPLRDIRFLLEDVAALEAVSALPGFEEATPDVVMAVLEEAGKFATEVLSPLNRSGDREGCRLAGGEVTTPPGWKDAYRRFQEAGWGALALPVEFGGQGLPKVLATPVGEMWASANLAFSLLFPLTAGATEALLTAASDDLKQAWLPRLVNGEWTSTMTLTEPQAGSDLSLLRTRAEPQADGSYRLTGQKIFITYGEHDLTDNIVHLVLARLTDSPAGIKGISLFVVPKMLPDADGAPGARNDITCVAIEYKLGIHGSPTCALSFGDKGGAVGYLVGEANEGLKTMFVMMNAARFATGMQGVAIAERAYQQALAYARERRQGRDPVSGEAPAPIIRHPDVKRMLLSMRADVMAARALAYAVAAMFDRAHRDPDPAAAARSQRCVDLLTPVIKGWISELAQEVASTGIQVHGGMGYVEETGAAQFLRDARIISIYEGTTGIQANDLIGRKLSLDQGASLRELIAEFRSVAASLNQNDRLAGIGSRLDNAAATVEAVLAWILASPRENAAAVLAGAVPFLRLMGGVCGGWQIARAALAAQARIDAGSDEAAYYQGIVELAGFYVTHRLPLALAEADVVLTGATSVIDYPDSQL